MKTGTSINFDISSHTGSRQLFMKSKLTLLMILVPFLCIAQHKKEILMYACQFISGSADGVNQAIVSHQLGAGTRFWDFQTSWKN